MSTVGVAGNAERDRNTRSWQWWQQTLDWSPASWSTWPFQSMAWSLRWRYWFKEETLHRLTSEDLPKGLRGESGWQQLAFAVWLSLSLANLCFQLTKSEGKEMKMQLFAKCWHAWFALLLCVPSCWYMGRKHSYVTPMSCGSIQLVAEHKTRWEREPALDQPIESDLCIYIYVYIYIYNSNIIQDPDTPSRNHPSPSRTSWELFRAHIVCNDLQGQAMSRWLPKARRLLSHWSVDNCLATAMDLLSKGCPIEFANFLYGMEHMMLLVAAWIGVRFAKVFSNVSPGSSFDHPERWFHNHQRVDEVQVSVGVGRSQSWVHFYWFGILIGWLLECKGCGNSSQSHCEFAPQSSRYVICIYSIV